MLQKFEHLFNGSLGAWNDAPHNIKIKPDVTPYHARWYSIPKCHDSLVKLGVLRKVNHSNWAAPSFIMTKKDQTVRFLTDFRELNKRMRRHPFPTPKIQEFLLKLEGFQFSTSLDLNMGYCHI